MQQNFSKPLSQSGKSTGLIIILAHYDTLNDWKHSECFSEVSRVNTLSLENMLLALLVETGWCKEVCSNTHSDEFWTGRSDYLIHSSQRALPLSTLCDNNFKKKSTLWIVSYLEKPVCRWNCRVGGRKMTGKEEGSRREWRNDRPERKWEKPQHSWEEERSEGGAVHRVLKMQHLLLDNTMEWKFSWKMQGCFVLHGCTVWTLERNKERIVKRNVKWCNQ